MKSGNRDKGCLSKFGSGQKPVIRWVSSSMRSHTDSLMEWVRKKRQDATLISLKLMRECFLMISKVSWSYMAGVIGKLGSMDPRLGLAIYGRGLSWIRYHRVNIIRICLRYNFPRISM